MTNPHHHQPMHLLASLALLSEEFDLRQMSSWPWVGAVLFTGLLENT